MVNAVIEQAVLALVMALDVLDRFQAMMRSTEDAPRSVDYNRRQHQLADFAASVATEKDAVAAAISSPWSSGQVEGNVTRLKSIKRQMYSRAKLDLPNARMMARA